jgi:hypothetical protein
MGKFRNELHVTYSGLSDDLNSRSRNHKTEILEYQNNMESLKSKGISFFKKKVHFFVRFLGASLCVMIWQCETYLWAVKNWQ